MSETVNLALKVSGYWCPGCKAFCEFALSLSVFSLETLTGTCAVGHQTVMVVALSPAPQAPASAVRATGKVDFVGEPPA